MKAWLIFATEHAVLIIDALAAIVVLVGTVEAFVAAFTRFFSSRGGHEARAIWLRYSRWLVAGLTFQLAADILETSITTSWDAVARIAAIAVIRTFLNYFLETDMTEIRARDRERPEGEARKPAAAE